MKRPRKRKKHISPHWLLFPKPIRTDSNTKVSGIFPFPRFAYVGSGVTGISCEKNNTPSQPHQNHLGLPGWKTLNDPKHHIYPQFRFRPKKFQLKEEVIVILEWPLLQHRTILAGRLPKNPTGTECLHFVFSYKGQTWRCFTEAGSISTD